MVLFIMSIHFAMAALILLLWRVGSMHLVPSMLPVLLLLPLWGPAAAIVYDQHVRGGERSDEEARMERFGITDEVYRSIPMEESGASGIRPIEDVLATGAPAQRRSLLLSVLHQGSAPFVRPLRIAGVNDDTEVVHYAVTALVELRSEFSQRLSKMEERLQAHPYDADVLREYAALDEEYIASGIPENDERDERLAHCRSLLEKLLLHPAVKKSSLTCNAWRSAPLPVCSAFAEKHAAARAAASVPPLPKTGEDAGNFNKFPQDSRALSGAGSPSVLTEEADIFRRLGEICLLQGDDEGARKAAFSVMELAPDREEGYLLYLNASALARDGEAISRLTGALKESGIYLSPDARKQLEFWSA